MMFAPADNSCKRCTVRQVGVDEGGLQIAAAQAAVRFLADRRLDDEALRCDAMRAGIGVPWCLSCGQVSGG